MAIIKSVRVGATSKSEKRDCVVRALSNAINLPYEQSHELIKTVGKREDRKAAHFHHFYIAYLQAGAKRISFFGSRGKKRSEYILPVHSEYVSGVYRGMTLERALPMYHTGRYIFIIGGHALAVVDGQVIDKGSNRAGCHLEAVFSFGR